MSIYLGYAARGENAWWRYLAGSVLGVVLAIALGIAVATTLQVLRALPADFAAQIRDARDPVGFFILNGVLFGLMLAGFAVATRLVHGKRFADILGAWSWRAFGRGAAIWSVVLVAATLVDFAIAPSGFSVTASRATAGLALAAAAGLALQTLAEEFVFRGYLTQGLLLATRRPLPAAGISGLLFGALHIPNGAPQAVSATVFGIVLALIAIRTGGIAFTYGLHLANNFFGAVVVVSSGDAFRGSPGLFTQATPHLMWWDAGVGAAALLLLAVAMAAIPRPGQGPLPGEAGAPG